MHRINSLDLAGCPKRRHGKSSKLFRNLKIRGTLHKRVVDLRNCDYVDPPRDQGLRDAISRVFKTPPETLQRPVMQDQVQPIQSGNFPYKTNLEDYTGPFDMGVTYAISIYTFAMKKWQRCLRTSWLQDKEAAGLVWGLLALVCRETRSVTGQDIANLLLSNPLAFEKGENLLSSGEGHQALVNLIISGKKEEAEQLAKSEALWDHWVILKGFAKGSCDAIVMRLIEHLKPNDPMKTYYQVLMGIVPTAACECAKNNWGDWRPHLAMVLSHLNKNSLKMEIMEAMAETLGSDGKPNSAYLCNLIMHLHCGIFSERAESCGRGVRSRPFVRSTRAAVERMEVYDYVLTLKTDQPFLSEFQHYRTLCIRMLLRAGYIQQALHFCETVGMTLVHSEGVDSTTLVEFVKVCSEFRGSQQGFIEPDWMFFVRETAEQMIVEIQQRSAAIKALKEFRIVKTVVAPEQPGPATSPDLQPGPATTSPDPQPGPATTSPDQQPGTATTSPDQQPGPATTSVDHQSGPATTSVDHQPGTTTTSVDHQPGTTTTSVDHQPGTTTTSVDHQPGTATTSPDHQSGPATTEKPKKKNKGCFGWLSCFRCFCFRRKKTH
ncbi:protein transport protein Sec16A-like [Alosa alosa]|uniref:protein transport protein Sec16A-like n=1 Tax=Alosa alosa TaxID=278164 RepID=UPI00201541FD|nr:protein transport protein Sec16A-like [Alosa alosa]